MNLGLYRAHSVEARSSLMSTASVCIRNLCLSVPHSWHAGAKELPGEASKLRTGPGVCISRKFSPKSCASRASTFSVGGDKTQPAICLLVTCTARCEETLKTHTNGRTKTRTHSKREEKDRMQAPLLQVQSCRESPCSEDLESGEYDRQSTPPRGRPGTTYRRKTGGEDTAPVESPSYRHPRGMCTPRDRSASEDLSLRRIPRHTPVYVQSLSLSPNTQPLQTQCARKSVLAKHNRSLLI